ncbi:response regulator [Paenibacillus sp. KQZ6P-2]|uniref:Response regulator n=1 Tax=Paenibacillus mangrovi TaxID=2931978 RepID=A0A9X2B3H8_9BACL|nr:response regulator [Paenibacillus mangrovi]MCJ8013634.1 response regulator [Paenibacillus mangrovi]
MIKALIVDDEKLVRKGIISVFPWDQYQIEIMGEAGNGEIALKLLQENPAELIFVDLTMPVMGGLELMRKVRERFPDTWMVVLTCHQDFNYVQEAMRLGAIDYIVKTQLDQETIEEILARITSRILKEKHYRMMAQSEANDASELSGHVLVGETTADFPLNFIEPELVFKINNGIWYISSMKNRNDYFQAQSFIYCQDHWIWLDIQGKSQQSTSAFYITLRTSIPLFLFYHFEPGQKVGECSLNHVAAQRLNSFEEWEILERKWLDMNWIFDDDEFASLIDKMAHTMPEREKVDNLMNGLLAPWAMVIKNELNRKRLHHEGVFPLWSLCVSWLKSIRSDIQNEMKRYTYTPAIIVNLVKAIRHIQQSDDYSFSRDELAAKYLMSGSYFSQIFKDIVSKAYGEYVKETRLSKAVIYLQETNRPIYQIAELTGFQDDKYFSKVFRNYFGKNPLDYRKQWIANNKENV